MGRAADQTVQLVKLTPHRAVRELYEQFIAYARAYIAAIPTYTASDNHLVGAVGASFDSACEYLRCNFVRRSLGTRPARVGAGAAVGNYGTHGSQ